MRWDLQSRTSTCVVEKGKTGNRTVLLVGAPELHRGMLCTAGKERAAVDGQQCAGGATLTRHA